MSAVVQMKPHRSDQLAAAFAKYSGREAIKPRQVQARQAATICTTAAVDYLPFITEAERAALANAALILRALGNDLEVAARKAEKGKKRREEEWRKQEDERFFALYAGKYGHLSDDALGLLGVDLSAAYGEAGTAWYRQRKKEPRAYWDLPSVNLCESIRAFQTHRSPESRRALKISIGRILDEHSSTSFRSGRYGTWLDFQAWLDHRAFRRAADHASRQTADMDDGDAHQGAA